MGFWTLYFGLWALDFVLCAWFLVLCSLVVSLVVNALPYGRATAPLWPFTLVLFAFCFLPTAYCLLLLLLPPAPAPASPSISFTERRNMSDVMTAVPTVERYILVHAHCA
jgi:hypothetical protein